MISIALLLALIGLILWLIFSKTKLSDPWLSRVGEFMFFCGLLGWVLSLAGKVAF